MLRQAKRGGGAQRNNRGLQRQRRNQSAAVAHSATAAARWEQRSNATDSPSGSAVGAALERHQLADVRVFVLGRGRRDDSVDGIVVFAMTAAPVATSTAVANAPPLPTTSRWHNIVC